MRAIRILVAALSTLALVLGVMPQAHADGPTSTYIVELQDGLSAKTVIPTLLGSDAKILEKAISGGVATLTAAQAAALAENPEVKSVRLDTKVSTGGSRTTTQPTGVSASSVQSKAPWDLDILDSQTASLDTNYAAPNNGSGVSVYVVDTGVMRTHSQLAGVSIATGYDFVSGDSDPSDCDGQGTGVASVIAGSSLGVAKGVSLIPLRVLDCNGSGYASDLLAALDYIVTTHTAGTPAIVDIGLGADALTDLDTAVQNVINAGITVVVAGDFQNVDACQSSPGRVPGAITVAASTSANGEAANTSYGSCIDLYAPGQDVSIADITSTTSTATGSGTAYAAGIVTGIGAQILHNHPTWTPAQVSSQILGQAVSGKITNARSANKLANVGLVWDSFVKASYMDFLHRLPTADELAAQVAALQSGSTTTSAYLTSLSKSDEWLTAIVTKMYADTLNRAPDAAGLSYWVGLLRNGTFTVAKVASLFYSSKEYYSTYAGNTPSSWVTLLYKKLLNRDPDASGLQFWINYTTNPSYGMDWVAYNFYQSVESRQRRVENIYLTLLNREPDPVGWPFWTSRVLTTGDLQLAWEVANSDEYWDRAHLRY